MPLCKAAVALAVGSISQAVGGEAFGASAVEVWTAQWSSEFWLKHSVLGGRHDSVLAKGTAV